MLMRFYVLVIVAFAFAATALPVFAQEQAGSGVLLEDTAKIPDAYIREMDSFYSYCLEDPYLKKDFDCRCLAVKYVEKRTEKGPAENFTNIVNALDKQTCLYDSETPASAAGTGRSMEEISDKDMKEAQAFYENCTADRRMSVHYDCECMSVKYLDQRLQKGPAATHSEIMLYINKECPNTAGIAGLIYNQCLGQGTLMPLSRPLEDFCECYANTFATLVEKTKIVVGSPQHTGMRAHAMLECRTERPGGIRLPPSPRP